MIEKINLNSENLEILRELAGQKIVLKNSLSENKNAILDLQKQGLENSLEYLARKKRGHTLSLYEENNLHKALLDLQKKLGLKNLPQKIECFDISHLSGKFAYGSMVTFLHGKPAKKYYRIFKALEKNNDFENMKNVLNRRFLRAINDENDSWNLPDLIIIDGGKGQLSSVLKVWDEFLKENSHFKNSQTFICALAKKEERIFYKNGEDFKSVLFDGFTKFLIQRIRDETHRFGIRHNRKARLRTISKSSLQEIAGVGQKTAKKLLQEFGSTAEVVETLWNQEFLIKNLVGEAVTEKLKKHFGIWKK